MLVNNINNCSACGLCLLNCPSFSDGNDIMNSQLGRLRTLNWGASFEDVSESFESCKHCSLCDEICPENIDLFKANRVLVGKASDLNIVSSLKFETSASKIFISYGAYELTEDFEKISFDSSFLAEGKFSDIDFVENITKPLAKFAEVVTDDYKLLYYLRKLGNLNNVYGLGETLIGEINVKNNDLFVAAFYGLMSDYKKLFPRYDKFVRIKNRANLFVDLNRLPFYTEDLTSESLQEKILISTKGLKPERIIVEDLAEFELFSKVVTDVEVLFAGDLIK